MRRGRGGAGSKRKRASERTRFYFLKKETKGGKKASSAMQRKAPSMKVNSNRATLSKLSKPSQHEAAARRRRSSKLKKKPRPKGPRMRSSGFSFPAPVFRATKREKKSKPISGPSTPAFLPLPRDFFSSSSLRELSPPLPLFRHLSLSSQGKNDERNRRRKVPRKEIGARERKEEGKKGKEKKRGERCGIVFFYFPRSLKESKRRKKGQNGAREIKLSFCS